MKRILIAFLLVNACLHYASAQEYFTIKQYDVRIKVNQDASLDVTEVIDVTFTEPRHGIYRDIPYRYPIQSLLPGTEKADRQLESGGYSRIIIEDISVDDFNYNVSTEGDYKEIKIGSKNSYVDGNQRYVIHYRILNAINFFKDHSELYFNVIGDRWPTTIDAVNFSIELYDALPATPSYFVATGYTGSQENNTVTQWVNNETLSGQTTRQLNSHEGLTVGIAFPDKFLIKQNYWLRGMAWMFLPIFVFIGMFSLWRKIGKDDDVTIRTEFYPPDNVSPSVAGYIIDDKLNRRDLTALVPYWGAYGYIQVNEIEKKQLFGLIKSDDFEFVKLKELPHTAMSFEKTMFNGIFAKGDKVTLSSLKNVLYSSMNSAKSQLEKEVDKGAYYVKYSRGLGIFFIVVGIGLVILSIVSLISEWGESLFKPLSFFISGAITIGFAIPMPKKSKKGTELYQKLAGFKEFIEKVETPRLEQFLKEDEHYFDKVLPFAIVFDVADSWKDKLKDLDVPPPTWYHGNQRGFTTYMFLNSLDRSMNEMSKNFYSQPSSRGSSGGSWSGGGGFSGGGFGGGGGGSW